MNAVASIAIAAQHEGGFYTARFRLNGVPHALITAEKAFGEHAPVVWNDSQTMVEGALSWHDGYANTVAMAKAGSRLAQWALDQRINGFADWYIASIDELELQYRAFKPTADANTLYGRSGINVSADPPTYPYTREFPAQTSVEIFRAGGPEAFEPAPYHSSTQHAGLCTCAWGQDFAAAARTTGASTTSSGAVSSADHIYASGHAEPSFEELALAYFDCRKRKRNTLSALLFEQDLESNLRTLHEELLSGEYGPGRSICFVLPPPRPREVWAAQFRDRIVQHLLYNRVAPRFHASFIADSCACIPGRGTLYAVQRLGSKVRSLTQNWRRRAFYLKCDLANFFVSIDKRILRDLLAQRIHEPWWMRLAETILFHDPRNDVIVQGAASRLALIPPHKSLFRQDDWHGLPIGNLDSQFFANVYLDLADQHAKHVIRAKHYIRYVDDVLFLHESPQWLNEAREKFERVLDERLSLQLNPSKTIVQPIDRGIDFVGQVIKPWRRTTRRRVVRSAVRRVRKLRQRDVWATANSYFGLLRQATRSYGDRWRVARAILRRGHAVDFELTKCFRTTTFRS